MIEKVIWLAAAMLAAGLARGQDPGSPAAQASASRAPARSGPLGGGYKDAKWGMSLSEVKKLLPGRIEYETRLPKIDKTLRYNLGEGKKLVCSFNHDQFYHAFYSPMAQDGDLETAQAVLTGLRKKFGPGKVADNFVDGQNRPLIVVTWNDGVTQIELRMPDPASYGAKEIKPYPSSAVMVIYTGIELNARKERERAEERRRDEADKIQKTRKNVESDL